MTKSKTAAEIETILKWWRGIEAAHKNRQPISVEDFADQSFKYVPLLLNEIERLQKERK